MTKTDLIAQVAANTEMSKKSAEQAVSAVFEALGKAMTEGEKITISGFGTFEVRRASGHQPPHPRAHHHRCFPQHRVQARQVPEGHSVIGSVTPPLPAQGAAAFLLKGKEQL